MEDESGLELSLGLSFGGSSSKIKVEDSPLDPKTDEGSSCRLMGSNMAISNGSLKNYFGSGLENQETKGKQESDLIAQSQEKFFVDLAKCPASKNDFYNDARNNLVQFTEYQQNMISNNRTIETIEKNPSSNKRKLHFEEINFQSKHEKFVDYVDRQGAINSTTPLLGNSHVSNTTEDGSTGENEEVAESETEGPQPWLALQREEHVKSSNKVKFNGKSILSEYSGISSKGLRESCLPGKESNSEYGKPAFGIPLSLQPLEVVNVPYPIPITLPSVNSGSNVPSFSSASAMQLMPIINCERPVTPTANNNSMQLAFGYSSVQLPTLETGSSWAFNSQPLHESSFTSKEQSAGGKTGQHFEDGVKTSQDSAPQITTAACFSYDGKSSSDLVVAGNNPPRCEDQSNINSRKINVHASEAMSKPALSEVYTCNGTAPAIIRPGISPDLRFGGSGSYPELPWVSTTGKGPNGKTISGVTYKYSQNQIKIVCACHGIHMSPEEFIQHASSSSSSSSAQVPLSENNNQNLAPFPTSNTSNSPQS